MAKTGAAKRIRYTCPSCGKVGVYPGDEPIVCKQCGTPEPAPIPAHAPTLAAAPPAAWPPQPPVAAAPSPDGSGSSTEPPTAFAIVALVCGLATLASLWFFPLSLLLAASAVGFGAAALSNHKGDTGVQVMAVIGIVLGVLALLLLFFVGPWFWGDGGSSYYYSNGGSSSQTTVDNGSGGGGSSGGGGGGGGSGGGGAGGGGGSGGDSGGGGGGGTDVGVDTPAPIGLLVGTLLLGLAAWRRRT